MTERKEINLTGFESKIYDQYKKLGSKLLQTVTEKEGDNRVNLTKYHPFDYSYTEPDQADDCFVNDSACLLGRRTDQIIIYHLSANAKNTIFCEGGMTKDFVLSAYEKIKQYDNLYAVVGWRQWDELLKIQEFEEADYVGAKDLNWLAMAKKWMGTIWIPQSNLYFDDNNIRYCLWYDKSAVIHADGNDLKLEYDFISYNEKWLTNFSMSQGAKIIDPNGVIVMGCLEI